MTRLSSAATIGTLFLLLAESTHAEPAWTKSGDCMSCHSSYRPGLLNVFNQDGWAAPEGLGSQKVYHLQRGQKKALSADVTGLNVGDKYAVELTQFKYRGILREGELKYLADCNWAEWRGEAHTFTDPAFFYTWGSDPVIFPFELEIRQDASYDIYELVFAVAGKDQNGELFYSEEPFYLQVGPADTGPTLISAVSRRSHGPAGELDINLPLDSAQSGVECRAGGPTRIIFTFSKPIITNTPSPVTVSAGTISNIAINDSVMTIELNSIPDQTCLLLSLNGIEDLNSNPLSGDKDVHIRVLLGDTDGTSLVNITDLGKVKKELFKPVTSSNCVLDINSDGVISINDLSVVRSNLFKRISCP